MQQARSLLLKAEVDSRLLSMLVALIVIWIGFNLWSGGQFLQARNLWNLSVQTASVAVMATGMVLFANMTSTTPRGVIVAGMIVCGLGMGLLLPVYTVAVQNVAHRSQMGAATASTVFFRSIGSTVGVAMFGTVMLMNYHQDFARALPAGVSPQAAALFSNPLMLQQMRPQLEAAFAGASGQATLALLLGRVPQALSHGLHLVFRAAAVLMVLSVFLHLAIKNLPLRGHAHPPEPEMPAH